MADHLANPPRFDELPDLCTPEQARAFLQVGRTTIYELVKSGALPHRKFGTIIRIPKAALLDEQADTRELPRLVARRDHR